MKRTYIYANSEILYQRNDGATTTRYYYLHDRLGSVREVIRQTGAVVKYYTFDPFGKLLTAENAETAENTFKFTGKF